MRKAHVILGLVLALAAGELLARSIYFVPLDYDPIFGPIIRPGSTAHMCREGFGVSHWTAHGLRRASPPDPEAPSILALGDSYTEALGVDDDQVFTQRLEKELGGRVQVLDAGRAGASIADYIALAPTYASLWHPRWTVVQLREKDLTTDAWDKTKEGWARFRRSAGGALELVPAVIEPRGSLWHLVDPLRRSLALFSFGVVRYREFHAAAESEAPLFRAGDAHVTSGPVDGNSVLSAEEARRYPIAEEFEQLEAAYQGRVTILFLPDFDPRAPTKVDSVVEETLNRLCATRGWSCVNLRDHYADFAARHVSPFGFANSGFNFGHMNPLGHATAATALAHELSGRLRDLL